MIFNGDIINRVPTPLTAMVFRTNSYKFETVVVNSHFQKQPGLNDGCHHLEHVGYEIQHDQSPRTLHLSGVLQL